MKYLRTDDILGDFEKSIPGFLDTYVEIYFNKPMYKGLRKTIANEIVLVAAEVLITKGKDNVLRSD